MEWRWPLSQKHQKTDTHSGKVSPRTQILNQNGDCEHSSNNPFRSPTVHREEHSTTLLRHYSGPSKGRKSHHQERRCRHSEALFIKLWHWLDNLFAGMGAEDYSM